MNRRSFFKSSALYSSAVVGGLAFGSETDAMDLCSEDQQGLGYTENGILKLRSAENPYGPPPSAIEAVQKELVRANRYPRPVVTAFREQIANDLGLTADHVAIGAGSIELIIKSGLAFGQSGREVVSADLTWSTGVRFAEKCGATWTKVPLTKDHHYDFDRMLDSITDQVDLVYICHPNNPTGLAEDPKVLKSFVQEASGKTCVMVDEAFIECLEGAEKNSMKHLVAENENVLVVRTFSKLWGMAGFRVGYMVGSPDRILSIRKTIPTQEMHSRIGVAAAIAAYEDDAFIAMSREKMRESRKMIFEILEKRGLKHFHSDTNFVAFEVPTNGKEFVERIAEQGVSIKPVKVHGSRNWCRVSCGKPNEIDVFDSALQKIL